MANTTDTDQQAVSGGFVPATAQSARHGAQPKAAAPNGPAPVGMAGQYSRNNPNYQNRKRGMSRGAKIGIAVIIVALFVGVGVAGAYVYKETQKNVINADLHSMTADQLEAVDAELTGSTSFNEPFTVLLLGSDYREDDPDMGARTDTIIVTRVDPVENTVTMMSIPRDTMIELEGVGRQKFNAAYTYGGESGTIAAVKQLCGIDIDHFAEVNFESMVGLIDAIGGIDVEVEEEIDDEDAGGHIDAGMQHLDGEHALIFARSRHYVDGDYTRQVNQRKVILAIVNKALTAPAAELSGLIQASTKFVTTDSGIDFDFIYSLADQMRHNEKPITIYSATIPSSTATIDDLSYVVADTAGVAEMVKRFMAGKDITKGVEASSISEDIDAAGGNRSSKEVGTIGMYEGSDENYEEYTDYGADATATDAGTTTDAGDAGVVETTADTGAAGVAEGAEAAEGTEAGGEVGGDAGATEE